MQSRNILLAGLMMSLGVSMLPGSVIATDASKFHITSRAVSDGATIPTQFTCSGANQSPPLSWAGVPIATKSLALLLEDPDAPNGTFVHWVVYDIPPTSSGFLAGKVDGKQGVNSAGEAVYMGPCPPPGSSPHHYHFELSALDTMVDIKSDATAAQLEKAAQGHVKAAGDLVGTFAR